MALAVGVVAALRVVGLDKAALWATVLAPALPIATTLLQWAYQSRAAGESTLDQVDLAAQELRSRVLEQWRDEAALRQLLHTKPLPVKWKVIQPDIADGGNGAGIIAGRTDEIDQLVDAFLKVADRRLVVL